MMREAPPETTSAALIGVDWGTTHLRAYRISSRGQTLERRQSPRGISSLRHGEFADALDELIRDWRNESLPVLLCGMVSSRQGWREVPYTACPASLADVGTGLVQIETPSGGAWIVGGISTEDSRGRHDVMRGEETQIFGACEDVGRRLIVAPGTHSKWALVHDRTVEHFRTYLTGELYAVLREHSSLGWAMEGREAEFDERSFLAGVRAVHEDPDLSHTLFTVRTRTLFEGCEPGEQGAHLSGILIGNEILSGLKHHAADSITLIASASLGRWYSTAFSALGRSDVKFVDAEDAVVQGLWKLWEFRGAHRER